MLVDNDSASPVTVPFNFIINEGLFLLVAGEGSTLDYELRVNGLSFVSTGSLEAGPGPSFFATFTTAGQDLGAAFDGEYRVDVPFSVQGVSETLQPGGGMSFTYDLTITARAEQFAEIIRFEFRDPAEFPDLPADATQFGPAPGVAAVAEPSPLLALTASLLLLGVGRRLARWPGDGRAEGRRS